MEKIRDLLWRCQNGMADIHVYPDGLIKCELWENSWIDQKDLHTLLEEKGIIILKVYASNNKLCINLKLIED